MTAATIILAVAVIGIGCAQIIAAITLTRVIRQQEQTRQELLDLACAVRLGQHANARRYEEKYGNPNNEAWRQAHGHGYSEGGVIGPPPPFRYEGEPIKRFDRRD